MKKFFIVVAILFAFFTVLNANEENTPNPVVTGTVNATRLNLRMAPSLQSPRAGIVKKDTKLNIVARHDNWLALEIPSSVKVFISEAYIHNNKTIRRVAMRSGMSASAPTYGDLPKGFEVKVMEERNYGWVRIEPPKHLRVYAAIVYVDGDLSSLKNEPYTPQDIVAKKEDKKAEEKSADVKPKADKVAETKETKQEIPQSLKDVVATEEDEAKPVAKATENKVAKQETAKVAPAKETKAEVAKVAETKVAKQETAKVATAKETKAVVVKDTNKAAKETKAEVVKDSNKAAKVTTTPVKKAVEATTPVKEVTPKTPEKKTTAAKAIVSWEEVDKAIDQLGAKRTGPVKANGILIKVPKSINAATEYALVACTVNLGFVSTADKNLLSFYLEKKIAIEGDKYVVNNWKSPIIKVFSIKLAQ
jgi:hypothetical protein